LGKFFLRKKRRSAARLSKPVDLLLKKANEISVAVYLNTLTTAMKLLYQPDYLPVL